MAIEESETPRHSPVSLLLGRAQVHRGKLHQVLFHQGKFGKMKLASHDLTDSDYYFQNEESLKKAEEILRQWRKELD